MSEMKEGDITTDPMDIERIIKEHYEQLSALILHNLDEIFLERHSLPFPNIVNVRKCNSKYDAWNYFIDNINKGEKINLEKKDTICPNSYQIYNINWAQIY